MDTGLTSIKGQVLFGKLYFCPFLHPFHVRPMFAVAHHCAKERVNTMICPKYMPFITELAALLSPAQDVLVPLPLSAISGSRSR